MHESHRAEEREQQVLTPCLETTEPSQKQPQPEPCTQPWLLHWWEQSPQKSSSLYNWVSNNSQKAAGEGANPSFYSSLPKGSLCPLIPLQRGTRGLVVAILSQHSTFSWAWSPPGVLSDALDQGQEITKSQEEAQCDSNEQELGKERQESYIKKSPSFWFYFSPKLTEFVYFCHYRTHCTGTNFLEKNLYC